MELIHMTDIIPLIGIPYPPYGRSSYYVPCPCCDDNPRKRHLNINLQKDVFRCPRCGFSGGVFDLYAHYAGIDRANARETLLERLNMKDHAPVKEHPAPSFAPEIECPVTDVETRDATYTAFLQRLTLATDHRTNLLNRGLSLDDIERLGYKTTPAVGTAAIARQLVSEGFYLTGVPGFYRENDDRWNFVHECRGILIPVRDPQGRIQGLQIRRDNVTRRKFRWVSSVGKKDGCRAEGWTHLAGRPRDRVILTEGPMKADVIASLTGQTVLAVPGVNALTQLETTLAYLRENGTESIMTAFDMDFLINPHVQNGYRELTKLLSGMGYQYGTYLWDPEYKGLDDYVWQFCYGNSSK